MKKYLTLILLLLVSFSVDAQTDAQLDQIRAEARKSGIEPLLAQVAQQSKSVMRNQSISGPFEFVDVTAKGAVMTTTWRAKNVDFKDIDKDIESQARSHTLKTICNQRVRGMLVQEFGATMLSRYLDKNDRLMWEVRVDKESCNPPAQAKDSLKMCNDIAAEAMKTMIRETQRTRRSFADCEVGDKGKVSMVVKVEYKRLPGKSFDDQKVELMGSDTFIGRGVCSSPMRKILDELKYDYRVETYFDGTFISATTVSIESCSSISEGQASSDPKSLAPQDMERIKTLVGIDKLGIDRYLRTMVESANAKYGQQVSQNLILQSATVNNNDLVYEYRISANRESIDLSKLEDFRLKERASTCNEQTMKIIISLFNVNFTKRFSDSKGEFLFEFVASREECRRVWRH
jgi:hypothetical protein